MFRRPVIASIVLALSAPLAAQSAPPVKPARFQGQVVDSAGKPVRAAVIETDDPPNAVVSDDSGFFRFAKLPAGPITVRVRCVGFEGIEFQLRLPPDSTVNVGVKLLPAARLLEAVPVGSAPEAAHPALARTGFYRRLRGGLGRLLTPEEIERRRSAAPDASTFLQGIEGITVGRGTAGGGLDGARGGAAITGKTTHGSACSMNLLVNGQPVKLGPGEALDTYVGVNDLYALEAYSQAADVPLEYRHLMENGECGAVIAWTTSKMTFRQPP